jgi:hypothetical protein
MSIIEVVIVFSDWTLYLPYIISERYLYNVRVDINLWYIVYHFNIWSMYGLVHWLASTILKPQCMQLTWFYISSSKNLTNSVNNQEEAYVLYFFHFIEYVIRMFLSYLIKVSKKSNHNWYLPQWNGVFIFSNHHIT